MRRRLVGGAAGLVLRRRVGRAHDYRAEAERRRAGVGGFALRRDDDGESALTSAISTLARSL